MSAVALTATIAGCVGGVSTDKVTFDATRELAYCRSQVDRTLVCLTDSAGNIDYSMTPRNIGAEESEWNLRSVATQEEWCAGFWPGILWNACGDSTADKAWTSKVEKYARGFTERLEYQAYSPVYDHDLGFIMIGSYMNGWKHTGDTRYKEVLLAATDTLATLYNPKVGTLLSWPRNVGMFGGHNTIIDNMINLELLFWAARNGGDTRLKDIAVSHADTTMAYHFRPDFTSYHVAVYDTLTGKHLYNCTHQGYADSTMWARGQAWAIYGYTMVYRETGERKYLDFARKVTDVYLDRLPVDGIPWWDFSAPHSAPAYRDASAAAIVASALIDLAAFVEKDDSARYMDSALLMLQSLSSETYQSRTAKPSFLQHCVGNLPAGSEIDASINYADYYYIEALCKVAKQQSNTNK